MNNKTIKNEMTTLIKLSINLDKKVWPSALKMLKKGKSAKDVARHFKVEV